ncbi:RNA recognition motif domain-containing protein, partial [Campylobacter fetus]
MNIYVGNLSYRMTESELREVFSSFGEVTRAKIVKDKETNRSKGFGFVEMSSDEQA